jgi:hypothetical protein
MACFRHDGVTGARREHAARVIELSPREPNSHMTGTGPKHHLLLAPVGDARQVFSSNPDIAVDSREQRGNRA